MEKLERVRAAACAAMMRRGDEQLIYQGMRHCEGLAVWCRRISQKRRLDPELAEVLAWLHDVYYFTTGIQHLHTINSAEQARIILDETGGFSDQELNIITHAVLTNELMCVTGGDYDELIKDAHVLLDYAVPTRGEDAREPIIRVDALERLLRLVPEWKLLPPHRSQVRKRPPVPEYWPTRAALGEVAHTIAQQPVNWAERSDDVRDIMRYYPEQDAYQTLDSNWCAAFVYHCCQEAGFYLPIRHPQLDKRFSSVRAWCDFGSLLTCGYYHPLNETGFTPERGDIVIFDRMLSNDTCDHMGIVVNVSSDKLLVAEGNARGENSSGILSHSRARHVRGYVRIPDGYSYTCGEDVLAWNAVG